MLDFSLEDWRGGPKSRKDEGGFLPALGWSPSYGLACATIYCFNC